MYRKSILFIIFTFVFINVLHFAACSKEELPKKTIRLQKCAILKEVEQDNIHITLTRNCFEVGSKYKLHMSVAFYEGNARQAGIKTHAWVRNKFGRKYKIKTYIAMHITMHGRKAVLLVFRLVRADYYH